MTSLVEPVPISESNLTIIDNHNTHRVFQRRCILKSKENIYKVKCNRLLKRKLKKYKLRQNGEEDQDVLDVSNILVSSLIIKSPNNQIQHTSNQSEIEEFRPKNYLFKMVRRKQVKSTANNESSDVPVNKQKSNKNGIPLEMANMNEEKKQTNAFQLLMDSRNKSLGCNSPGKEKNVNDTEVQEIIEKKNVKVKRLLVLQKMAEAKGALKKKETEEYQDKYINMKMKKRAEKLKKMLLNQEPKSPQVDRDIKIHSSSENKPSDDIDSINITSSVAKQTKTLQLVNIFNESDNQIKSYKKQVPKEDEEFLKKLSPSLKRKENMLCYFKKLDKEFECSPVESETDDVIIKVKLATKSKKKSKRNKLSLNKDIPCVNIDNENSNINQEIEVIEDSTDVPTKSDRQKRKRNFKINTVSTDDSVKSDKITTGDERPKRCVKRPVKYTDDVFLSSSDEELHIFTPKKKKHTENKSTTNTLKLTSHQNHISSTKGSKLEKKNGMNTGQLKKPVKLAPIFATKQPDLAAIEAKQKFLQSGVPDQLKKIIAQQKMKDVEASPNFPVVVHVQQKKSVHEPESPVCVNVPEINFDEEINCITIEDNLFKNLLDLSDPQYGNKEKPQINKNMNNILLQLKQLRPKFPVYRTYRTLRDKKKGVLKDNNYLDLDNSIEVLNAIVDVNDENPDQLSWTDKYKATSTNQIIGNFESIKELKKWLMLCNENEFKLKNKTAVDSDSSDFYQSDTDSCDGLRNGYNLLILTGPVGSGKTSSVYAAAAELAIKVIEVNVSNKRTGKIMLQDLQEATQSHKVNRGASNSENSQKSQEVFEIDPPKQFKKRGRPKKNTEDKLLKKSAKNIKSESISGAPASQEISRTHSSLILIDDADIVFDQDDGFYSAIVQLIQSSKRPVILVTSSTECPSLQRFLQNGKLLKLHAHLPRMLGTWLDIMCLADTGVCYPGEGAKFLDYFNGDIRKTINCLQFYVSTQSQGSIDEEITSQGSESNRPNNHDENSSMSWADREDVDERNLVESITSSRELNRIIWNKFIDTQFNLRQFQYPLELFPIWWNLPRFLSNVPDKNNKKEGDDRNFIDRNQSDIITQLESLANVLDSISISEYFTHVKPDTNANITCQPWFATENDSVSEQENFDDYAKIYELTDEVSHELVKNSILGAQKTFGSNRKTDIDFPGLSVQRQRDRIVTRHNNITSYFNPSAVLDRKGLALDYWATCRTICKVEKAKTDHKSRRNNRFCHYLKSLNVLCKSDMLDNLGDSLCFSKRSEFNFN